MNLVQGLSQTKYQYQHSARQALSESEIVPGRKKVVQRKVGCLDVVVVALIPLF